MTGLEGVWQASERRETESEDSAPEIADGRTTFDEEVSRFFYRWGGLLSSALIEIRARFQGDLDQYLIYLVFLLDDLSQTIGAQARGRRRREEDARGMNALSISEVTQIPRETARRKLKMLVASGYLDRGADGLYYLGRKGGLDQFFFDLSPLFWERLAAERAFSSKTVEPKPELADR